MRNTCRTNICRCHHRAPPFRVIRSVEFNRDLARKISDLELSGDATVDLVLTELLDHSHGQLFDAGGKPIDFASDKPADVARWDGLFSEDQRRFVNRYKERADIGFKNRLQERLVFPVTAMHFAMAIRTCRQSGQCISG